jgi:hypothetical protein
MIWPPAIWPAAGTSPKCGRHGANSDHLEVYSNSGHQHLKLTVKRGASDFLISEAARVAVFKTVKQSCSRGDRKLKFGGKLCPGMVKANTRPRPGRGL